MRFQMLGPVRVWDGASWIPIHASQQRVVLAVLLTEAGRAVSTERLVDAVWGSRPPGAASKTVQAYVMRLRRLLGDKAGRTLVTRDHGYELAIGDDELDARVFERLVTSARWELAESRPKAAVARLSEALALWRGPALADVPTSPQLAARVAQLEQIRLAAVEERLAVLLDLGQHAAVVDELHLLVYEHPLRERLWAQYMVALYRCDRRAEALSAYRRARLVLLAELGLEPGPPLRDLQQAILADDPAIVTPMPAGTGTAGIGPAQLPPDVPGFTGRNLQLDQLDAQLPADGRDTPGVMAISTIAGTAGVGKTALAVHWAHRVRDRFPDGQLYVNLRGHAAGAPLRPIEALAGFLPALGVQTETDPPTPVADREHETDSESGQVITLAEVSPTVRPSVEPTAQEIMWAHFVREQARGRIPTGAELDRIAGTNNCGCTVLRQWREQGRIQPVDRDRHNGHRLVVPPGA